MASKRKFKDYKSGLLLIAPALIVITLVIIYPFARGIWMSFLDLELLRGGDGAWVGLKNYNRVFSGRRFWPIVKNTFTWTFFNVLFQMSVGLGIAMLLNTKIKGRGTFRTVSMIPWVVPSVASALTWRWIYNYSYGVFNAILLRLSAIDSSVAWLGNINTAMPAVVFASIWKGLPFVTVMLLASLQPIPMELYESADIDGASLFQKLFHITLPLIKRTFAIATILTTIFTVNNFNAIWLMTEGGPLYSTEILFTNAYRIAFLKYDFGQASAVAVLLFIILSVFGFIYLYLIEKEETAK